MATSLLLATLLQFAAEFGVGYMPDKYNRQTGQTDRFVENPVTGYVGLWVFRGPWHIGYEHQSGLIGGTDPNGGVDSVIIKYRVESPP